MNALLLLRSHLGTAIAFGLVLLIALALTALRFDFPGEIPGLELLLFGWLGVALGRLAIGFRASESGAAGGSTGTAEKVDHILRSVARLLQTHLSESEAFSERLQGASNHLAQHESSGAVNDIVMALIDDNRQMRDNLSDLRNQLEESRLQVLRLQNNLERSEEAGMRDVVTAIGNRRFFETAFAEELEKARRTGNDFCLALADLDRFKLVNDRFGHLVGDRLLRLFADILVQNVRGQDRVAQFGGEEFAVMLPGARLSEAVEAVERIRRVLEFEAMDGRAHRGACGQGDGVVRRRETAGERNRRPASCSESTSISMTLKRRDETVWSRRTPKLRRRHDRRAAAALRTPDPIPATWRRSMAQAGRSSTLLKKRAEATATQTPMSKADASPSPGCGRRSNFVALRAAAATRAGVSR